MLTGFKIRETQPKEPHSSLRCLLFLGPGRPPHRFLEGEVAVARRSRRRSSAVPLSGGQDVVDDVLDVGVGVEQPLESGVLQTGLISALVVLLGKGRRVEGTY